MKNKKLHIFFTILLLTFAGAQVVNAADTDGDGVEDSSDAFPLDNTKSLAPRLSNISTRGSVKVSDEVMIGGMIITGSVPKTVVIRARGLSMLAADSNLTGLMADPSVQLFRGADLIDSNDNWESHSRATEVPENLRPVRSEEAAIMATLEPGAYTAIVRGVSNGQGVGIVEIFELSDSDSTKLSNISTRGFVGTNDDVLIGGVIVAGDFDKTVTVRARGPSLADADPNLKNLLDDPFMQLFNSSGELIDSNDNWADHSSVNTLRSDLKPSRSSEAAITRTLSPGAYTAIVRGVGGSTGIGIVEVFELAVIGGLTDTDIDGRPDDCDAACQTKGMIADTDDDNDSVLDIADAFPLINIDGRTDTDGDGRPNDCGSACQGLGMAADPDDDNDGVLDTDDAFQLITLGGLTDKDGDGRPDDCDAACQAAGMTGEASFNLPSSLVILKTTGEEK